MSIRWSLLWIAAIALPGLANQPADSARKRARAAFTELSEELQQRLQAAMQQGGPARAVQVCRKEAPAIAARVSKKHGFAVGRSSHRLRNPKNLQLGAIADYLSRYAESPAEKVPVEAVPEGKGWLVMAPIPTRPLCLTCHGDPTTFSADLRQELARGYPKGRATGFPVGQLRGAFWARLK